MLSLTGQYALRAMIHLARRVDDWPVPGREIAHDARIPRNYLSKVMGDLVRAGVLESTRGLGGGFRMARSPRKTYLFAILAPFENTLADQRQCPFANHVCSDRNPCLGHEEWKRVLATYIDFLRRTSIHDVAVERNGDCQ
jgi:Rrf2 family iron-sulfur cluster assembly transcriptional regulator